MAYLGTAYRGWQRQENTNGKCVQQAVEDALLKMTKTQISFMGCGRTDAGVHAMQYFGHFDYANEWTYDPVERLNRILPKDISVYEIIPFENWVHSRYDAIQRSYEYHIHFEKNPFLSPVSAHYQTTGLDLDLLKIGVAHIQTLTDFRHLCLTPDKFVNTFCFMYQSQMVISKDGKQICFRFTANRFLRSMIRIIVSRLIALGEGVITLDEFKDVNRNNQSFLFRTMFFPEGLHLTRVVYPYLEREPKANFLLN